MVKCQTAQHHTDLLVPPPQDHDTVAIATSLRTRGEGLVGSTTALAHTHIHTQREMQSLEEAQREP